MSKKLATISLFVLLFTPSFSITGFCETNQKLLSSWYLGESIRTIIGYEQAGASAAAIKQNFFFDMHISYPLPFSLGKEINNHLGPRARLWINTRLTSTPQQSRSSIGGSSIAEFSSTFYSQVSELKINEIAQAVEFLIGVEYLIFSHDLTNENTCSLSLIADTGFLTPLNPMDTIEIYHVSPILLERYSSVYDFTGKEYVAFIRPERDRFYRQYGIGLRLKSLSAPDLNEKKNEFKYKFPAIIDLTLALNDAVTGKMGLKNTIVRLDTFIPFRAGDIDIYIFGSFFLRTTHTKLTDPIILEPAPENTEVPAPNVLQITSSELNKEVLFHLLWVAEG